MRYYMPADDYPAPVRRCARQHKLEVTGNMLALLGVMLAGWVLANCAMTFAGRDHRIGGQAVSLAPLPDHSWDMARRISR